MHDFSDDFAMQASAEATLDERINSLESQVEILTSKLEDFQGR